MANTIIFALVALCAIFGVGLSNGFQDNIPHGFWDDGPAFVLSPKKVTVLGHYQKVFTFGNETNRKYRKP